MDSSKPFKITLESEAPFADHRVLQSKNYSLSFAGENTMFTSDHSTLYVNPEGGSVMLPEDNECEINRVVFMKDYIASFYPNQPVLIKTITGTFICATADHFRGYYTFGLHENLLNANRGVVLKNDNQLYFVTAGADVVHYDLAALIQDLRFKQETWSISNEVKATNHFPVDAKEICDDPNGVIYSLTSGGQVRRLPENKQSIVIPHDSHGSHIYFTSIAATEDYVCVGGYMKDSKHNAVQLIDANLTKVLDGPITTLTDCRLL